MSKAPVSLKAMAEGGDGGIQKVTIFRVDPDLVEFEEGFNLREEGPELDAHLEAMYVAMKGGAYFPPIDVSVIDGKIIARDGHCRTRTARRLKAEGIDYRLEARQFRGNEVDSILHMLGTANGKPLTPLEQGRGFKRLVNYGQTVSEIAARTGLHRTSIDNYLLLANAPVYIQSLIVAGTLSSAVAIDMLRKYGDKAEQHTRKLVEKTQAAGVTKVTKKHAAPRISQNVAMSFVSAASEIRAAFPNTSTEELLAMDDHRTVSVPAGPLKRLLALYAETQKEGDL